MDEESERRLETASRIMKIVGYDDTLTIMEGLISGHNTWATLSKFTGLNHGRTGWLLDKMRSAMLIRYEGQTRNRIYVLTEIGMMVQAMAYDIADEYIKHVNLAFVGVENEVGGKDNVDNKP